MIVALAVPLVSCGGTATPSASSDSSPHALYISPNHIQMGVGSIQHVSAFSSDSSGNMALVRGANVQWRSDETSIADVSGTGDVSAKSMGSTTIHATVGKTSTVMDIDSVATAATVTAVGIEQIFVLNNTAQWKAIATTSDGGNLDVTTAGVWQSSDRSTISIDPISGAAKLLKSSGQVYISFQYGSLASTKIVILGSQFP